MTRHYPIWHRIEPDPRNPNLAAGADLPFADPAWALARQYWVGEFDGYDGGSVTSATATWSADPLSGAARQAPSSVFAVDPRQDTAGAWRHALALGDEALLIIQNAVSGLLRAADASPGAAGQALREAAETMQAEAAELPEQFALTIPAPMSHRIDSAKRIDGLQLLAALRAGTLPRFAEVLHPFARRHQNAQATFDIPEGAQADLTTDGGRALRAAGGRTATVHWSAVADDAQPGAIADASLETTTVSMSRLSFAGDMPDRWWQVEPAELAWSSSPAGPSDLGQLLIAAGFSEQAGHWQIAPMRTPANAAIQITNLTVSDTFGTEQEAARLEQDGSPWHLASDVMLTLNEPELSLGPLVEIGSLIPDPGANLAWMVAARVEGPDGRGRHVSDAASDKELTEAAYTPRVAPPAAWVAYVPEENRLARRILRDDPSQISRFADDTFDLHSGMLGPSGVRFELRWAMVRGPDGDRYLWQHQALRPGQVQAGSGLAHDVIVKPMP